MRGSKPAITLVLPGQHLGEENPATKTFSSLAGIAAQLHKSEPKAGTRWLMEHAEAIEKLSSREDVWALILSRARLGLAHRRLILPVRTYDYPALSFDTLEQVCSLLDVPGLEEETCVRLLRSLRHSPVSAKTEEVTQALYEHTMYTSLLDSDWNPWNPVSPLDEAKRARRIAGPWRSPEHLSVCRSLAPTWTGSDEELGAAAAGILA